MITVTIKIDTNEHGKLHCKFSAEGLGTIKEKDLAVALVEMGTAVFDVVTLADGGNPITVVDPKSRITFIGQG